MLPEIRRYRRSAVFTLLGAALLLTPAASHGDDRQLLRESRQNPYVFILFDTSGSMNWSPKSTACPTGDCYVPLQADDPTSKFYQAKEALYEVLATVDDVQFGFSTYNQDALNVRAKHWLYEAINNGVNIPGWGNFPATGAREVFGMAWGCDTGNNDHEIGCVASKPADLSDVWERTRVQRVPKGGIAFNQNVDLFVRHASVTYRVRYQPNSGSLGSNIGVSVVVSRCTNTACSTTTAVGTQTVTWRVVSDFASWDNAGDNPSRNEPQLSYFTQAAASDSDAANTCSGWDPNTDTTSDRFSGYSTRWPTVTDPRGSLFSEGDIIPTDWNDDHRDEILRRLAPNTVLDSSATPDFRIATYFRNDRQGADAFLRLKDERVRPLVASGSTPLGNSVKSFRTWYAGCSSGTCAPNSGWKHFAEAQDPDWKCRRKFLLVITDGDDTCGGTDPCTGTQALFTQEGVKTFVVAFGVENAAGNKLNCMAANGGTERPIYPQNKEELVDALNNILSQIREEATAFASAAVPSVQAEVADRIFLSSFTPLDGEPIWDGHVDAYLKPLPLTPDGRPDTARTCPAGSDRSSCHLWDAGKILLTQAPDKEEVQNAINANNLDEGTLKLGLGEDQRRVFYNKAPFGGVTPIQSRLLAPPGGNIQTDPEWADLWTGLKVPAPTTTAEYANTKKRISTIVGTTLWKKESEIEREGLPDLDITYILGDIFHSDPVIVDRPNEFAFYSSNLYGNPSATNCSGDPGYRCYAEKHRRRRKMLLVGSNDGQLHAFDGGVWDQGDEKFSDGTGKELFAFIPRPALPIVRDLAEKKTQIFGIDSTPRIDDVFIDPQHNGTPTKTQREWRTLVIGGFREGGTRDGGGRVSDFVSGYYALDITQPDKLDTESNPVDRRVVPSCLSTLNQTVSGCGTLPYPAVLWEFTDSIASSRLDEDDVNGDRVPEGNGSPDLGQTWSVPTVGRIRVIEGGEEVDKFVAIFGGGMDAANKLSPQSGTWLYMVDIETGKAIYKRHLVGAVPSDPAAIDTDLDGYLDTLYIGTTGGFLYKVSIGSAAELKTVTLKKNLALPVLAADQQVLRITDASWEPFPIFDTIGKPIYFAPTAFFVSSINRFALAFGTGDREDLWSETGQEGRFFVIVDDNFNLSQVASGVLPKDETDYEEIQADDPNNSETADFVLRPATGKEKGWFLSLSEDERVITQGFGLSGIVIFSSFEPTVTTLGGSGSDRDDDAVCARGGESHIFVVFANNANSIMSVEGESTRFRRVPEFVTNPYVEQGSTKNTPDGSNEPNSEQLDAVQQQIMSSLKKFFPKGTKFANYWVSVSGIRSDTGYERYATIPIGIIERNWKEH
jgi:Tfp pilus tip-associated adhesin PilY1